MKVKHTRLLLYTFSLVVLYTSFLFTARTSQLDNVEPFSEERTKCFHILSVPEVTTYLISNFTKEATDYYNSSLNEEQAEVWLHRGLGQLTQFACSYDQADAVFIPAYMHFSSSLVRRFKIKNEHVRIERPKALPYVPLATNWLAEAIRRRIQFPSKPHILLTPTWNPKTSRAIGLKRLVESLLTSRVNVFSVGFERNTFWQQLPANRIIPVPYVVKLRQDVEEKMATNSKQDSVFYVGDAANTLMNGPAATDLLSSRPF